MKSKTAGSASKHGKEHAESIQQKQKGDTYVITAESRIPMASDEGLLDFGKSIINSSIIQSIEFHKTMLGLTATFATLMASSFGIVVFQVQNNQIDGSRKVLFIIPILLMLTSSVCFTLGYYPRHIEVKLQVLDSIKMARNDLIRARRIWAFIGVTFFVLSIVALLVSIIIF